MEVVIIWQEPYAWLPQVMNLSGKKITILQGQGKFKCLREVREKWNFKDTNLFIANSAMFLCKQECELSTDILACILWGEVRGHYQD